jgi:hypothetical protein
MVLFTCQTANSWRSWLPYELTDIELGVSSLTITVLGRTEPVIHITRTMVENCQDGSRLSQGR